MDTKSQHLLMDLWLDQSVEPIVEQIKDLVEQNFKVVARSNKLFEPQGETIVFVLSESHFSLHTYPEHQYITLDIYICNLSIDMNQVKDKILKLACPIKHNEVLLIRGSDQGIIKKWLSRKLNIQPSFG